MSTILVSGATGTIGQSLVRHLIDHGVRPRLLVRHPDKLPAAVSSASEVVPGDLLDEGSLTNAARGATTFFFCIPQNHRSDDVRQHYLDFADAACRALPAAGVRRVVFVSSGGKGRAHDAGPISALHAVEDQLVQSGFVVAALRCGNFMENLLWQIGAIRAGVITYPIPGQVALPTVATRDIATVASGWLRDPSWTSSVSVGVHGPEDLSNDAVAERIGRVLGRSLRFREVPAAAYEASLQQHGTSGAYARGLVAMFREVTGGIYQAEPRTAATTTPTTIEAWTRDVLAPMLSAEAAR